MFGMIQIILELLILMCSLTYAYTHTHTENGIMFSSK